MIGDERSRPNQKKCNRSQLPSSSSSSPKKDAKKLGRDEIFTEKTKKELKEKKLQSKGYKRVNLNLQF